VTTGATPAGPFPDIKAIRTEAGISTASLCHLFDMPEST
jgi:hypothetical protein